MAGRTTRIGAVSSPCDGERDGGDVLARAHAQDVDAGVPGGRADLELPAALALALEPRRRAALAPRQPGVRVAPPARRCAS